MDETAAIELDPNPQVEVEFEKQDFSIGTARYSGATPITRNLSMLPAGRKGLPPTPICHANVEVRLVDEKGHKVPMTRRLVRTWDIQPLKGAIVDNLRLWRIVGLEQTEYSPFSPFPISPKERPGDANFKWDRPGWRDAQGLNPLDGKAFGILQEFVVGNRKVGGAYFQTYTLFDGSKCRTVNSKAIKLSASNYGKLLDAIDGGAYTKMKIRRLGFDVREGASDDTSDVPPSPH